MYGTICRWHLPASVSRQLGALILPGQNKALELALECESVVVLREYALGTDAIVFAPEDVMGVELESGRMCRLRIKELEALGSVRPCDGTGTGEIARSYTFEIDAHFDGFGLELCAVTTHCT